MNSLLPIVLIVVDIGLIGLIVMRTAAQRAALAAGQQAARWHAIVKGLIVAPPLILLGIATLIVVVWRTEPFARLTHAVLVLGLWMPATVLMFQTVALLRSKHDSPLMSVVGCGLALPLVIYLTPIDHFHTVFDSIGYGWPLVAGLILDRRNLFGVAAFRPGDKPMTNLIPWFHILLALIAYFAAAVLASVVVRKIGGDLKSMAGRSSPRILLIGAVANFGVLVIVLLLLTLVDGLPISALGLTLTTTDLIGALLGAVTTIGLALAFVSWLNTSGKIQIRRQALTSHRTGLANLSLGWLVLFIVVLQEEVLYRGYVIVNLRAMSAAAQLLISTAIFVLIHFLTNKVNRFQVVSWVVSGLVLAGAYLASGSIWVPIMLHYATDLTNVMIFNITGQSSLFTISPALSERQRAVYRGVYGVAITAILLLLYSPMAR